MKKSFVYLIVALMLATFCACGTDDYNGVVGASPRPSDAVDIFPTIEPDVSVSMQPSLEPTSNPEVKSPQVGATDSVKASPSAGENTPKK